MNSSSTSVPTRCTGAPARHSADSTRNSATAHCWAMMPFPNDVRCSTARISRDLRSRLPSR
ncbi:hypothetical protein HNR68_001888 [Saccharopolyspora hordei]|uniref:Uncharacterized protein n=1 Tax=Saccharopolyspora hordei TaxID=1838 RepID=A0A853AGZ7_9PSEU|nr:hypothetical protein [Saccharopolyspora hordei]